MRFHYNKPPASSPYLCWIFLRRVAPGCGSKSRVSPPGRPHKFHKPTPAQSAPGKSAMALGHLTKGASWEELIQACLQSFGKSGCSFEITSSFSGQSLCITDQVGHVICALALRHSQPHQQGKPGLGDHSVVFFIVSTVFFSKCKHLSVSIVSVHTHGHYRYIEFCFLSRVCDLNNY